MKRASLMHKRLAALEKRPDFRAPDVIVTSALPGDDVTGWSDYVEGLKEQPGWRDSLFILIDMVVNDPADRRSGGPDPRTEIPARWRTAVLQADAILARRNTETKTVGEAGVGAVQPSSEGDQR